MVFILVTTFGWDHQTGTNNTDYIASNMVGKSRWEMVGEKMVAVRDGGSEGTGVLTESKL